MSTLGYFNIDYPETSSPQSARSVAKRVLIAILAMKC